MSNLRPIAPTRILLLALSLSVAAIPVPAQQQSPDPPPPPPILPTLSPPLPPPWIFVPRPDALPSPADAPVPDLASLPPTHSPAQSKVKRALDRAMPRCLDATTHTCWASPPAQDSLSSADREFANDMDVGKMYLKEKNYRGAEFRFRDALDRKPDQPEATFHLAKSLEMLSKSDQARQTYKAYLRLQSDGTYADQARQALHRLDSSTAGENP